MTFTNEPIDLDGVPRLDAEAFRPLDPAHRRLIVLGHIATGMVIAMVAGAAAAGFGAFGGLVGLGVLVLVVISAIVASTEAKHMGWQVREHDLSYRHGILTKSVDTLPFSRIQHARIERGPLQRTLGIATLHVNSAGPDVRISGLSADDVERLKTLVIERSGATDDTADA